MVKNTNGGKHKGVARKVVKANDPGAVSETKTRTAAPPLELYAQVLKRYGGSVCEVQELQAPQRRLKCHIRGKFTGRYKRSNTVEVGTFVLVGLRDWEREVKNVDLLHVYLPHDVQHLQSLHPLFAFTPLAGAGGGDTLGGGGEAGDDVVFSLSATDSLGRAGRPSSAAAVAVAAEEGGGEEEEPDFDLI